MSNLFDEERREIFGNIYLANIQNRLRELVNPNDIDCKRWPWELVQNAKDSISGQKDRKSVDIKINVTEDDTYFFKHNGSPFSIGNLTALLYKYSKGKANNSESTGRFGTGFLTTHSLSRIVKISGEIFEKGSDIPQGFSVTMFREGEGEELLKELKDTEDSYQCPIESDGWTTYEYKAITKRNKEAGVLGIQNFKENIARVMLFCPEINSINLDNRGKIFTIERGDEETVNDSDDYSSKPCKKLTLFIKDDNQTYKKTFLYLSINEPNEELTKRYNKPRNLRISCALELDENGNIFVDKSLPCLFCSLPLVGSESHELPFIINSPDFEPDSERQALLLDGNDIDEKSGKISDPGINKMILMKAQDMYRDLIDTICKSTIGNRYLLARGLSTTPFVTRFFDFQWYENYFIHPMRDILIQFPIAWNGQEYRKLTEICLPLLGNYKNNNDGKKEAFKFISQLYNNDVPTYDEALHLQKYIWKEDSRINYATMEDGVQSIQNYKTMDSFCQYLNHESPWTWLDSFLLFIKRHHYTYLEDYSIIPNMNGEFIYLTKELASCHRVPDNMIQCLEELNTNWKKEHIHKNIKEFSNGSDHDIDYTVSKIRGCLKTWSSDVLILMHYIPENEKDEEFVQKRKDIYEFCCTLMKTSMGPQKDGNDFPKELWNGIDDMVLLELIKKVEQQNTINELCTIPFLNKFLKCVAEYYRDFTSYRLVPNQNNKLMSINSLYKDENIPDLFKDCFKYCFYNDIKEQLIHKDIICENLKYIIPKRIYDYEDSIDRYFNMRETQTRRNTLTLGYSYLPYYLKVSAAKYLIRILPKKMEKKNEFSTGDDQDKPKPKPEEMEKENEFFIYDDQEKQRTLFDLYKLFTKVNKEEEISSNEIERNEKNLGIWKKANNYIYNLIKESIAKHYDIASLASFIGKSQDETLEYLNLYIKHFPNYGKIIPNQNSILCSKENLYNEGEYNEETKKIELIPDQLKDIAKNLGYDVRNNLVHKAVGRPCLNYIGVLSVYKKIDSLIKVEMESPDHQTNSSFKEATTSLLEEYFDVLGEEKAKEYFPTTYSNKDSITLNVIFDKQTRKNLTEFGKEYGKDAIETLLNNPEVVKKILNGELTDKTYNKQSTGSSTDTSSGNNGNNSSTSVITYGSNSVSISYNDEFDPELKSFIDGIMNYSHDFSGISKNRKTGYCGEAYIYELLLRSGSFKRVTWKMLIESGIGGEVLEYQGKTYHICEDGSHFDIEVETFEGHKIFIEVKSTKAELGNKIPFFLSQQQIREMQLTEFPNIYILAVVFDVMNNPIHFFLSLTDKLK